MILLACVSLALGVTTACSKDKAENPSNANESSQESMQEKMRAFTQCMRDHGIQMDDPVIVSDGEGGGKVEMRAGGASAGPRGEQGPGPQDEAFKKAEQECRHLMPQGGDLGNGPSPEDEERMRNFAKCMRENGVENFPDPQSGGGLIISPESGISPEDPTFKAAEQKCKELMPEPRMNGKVAS